MFLAALFANGLFLKVLVDWLKLVCHDKVVQRKVLVERLELTCYDKVVKVEKSR